MKFQIESKAEIFYFNLFQGIVITTLFVILTNHTEITIALILAFCAQIPLRTTLRPKLLNNIVVWKTVSGMGNWYWLGITVTAIIFIVINACVVAAAAWVLMKIGVEEIYAYTASLYASSFIELYFDNRQIAQLTKLNEVI